MLFTPTPLEGVYTIDPDPRRDDRGLFMRVFCSEEFSAIGFTGNIVQINHSVTRDRTTIRGMHYQAAPAEEIKIIRCVIGSVFDVAVDLRPGSSTYLRWCGTVLSSDNMRMVYIPEGCAHGFQALTDDTHLLYHHSAFYRPEFERGVRFDDPALAIDWPLPAGTVSARDRSFPFIVSDAKGGTR